MSCTNDVKRLTNMKLESISEIRLAIASRQIAYLYRSIYEIDAFKPNLTAIAIWIHAAQTAF